MPLTAVIVDDEPLARRELQYLLGRAGDVQVVAEATNGIQAVEVIRSAAPDVVFLDVQMPGLDGFAVLKKLLDGKKQSAAPMPEVVFATAFDQYAVRAFEVNAIDYLLKPFEERRVTQAIDKVRQRRQSNSQATIETVPQAASEERLESLLKLLQQQAEAAAQQQSNPASSTSAIVAKSRSGKVIVRNGQRMLLVDQHDVCFASIEEGDISVVTGTVEGLANCRTIEELADQVDPATFWRAHRSYLVNIEHIREVVPWFKSSYLLRMNDRKHTEIPVARAQIKRLRELFNL